MRTHPLLEYRLRHPAPIEDDIQIGDSFVLKTWEVNPSRDAQGHNPRIRPARTNYPYSEEEIRTLQRSPVYVLEAFNGSPRCLYADVASYFNKDVSKDDHGHRWFLLSDVKKVQL